MRNEDTITRLLIESTRSGFNLTGLRDVILDNFTRHRDRVSIVTIETRSVPGLA